MYKLLICLVLSFMLIGCSNSNNVILNTNQDINEKAKKNNELKEEFSYVVYSCDEECLNFIKYEKTTSSKDDIPCEILKEIHNNKLLAKEVNINSFEIVDNMVKLDLSENLLELIYKQGTTGEYYLVGSIVNSFIDTYNVEFVEILINGETFESGHVLYDSPLTKYGID